MSDGAPNAPPSPDLAASEQQRAEFLASFTCADPTGAKAQCARAPQRWGAQNHPRVLLPDDSLASCPVWISTKCRRFDEKYIEWLQIGRNRGIPERFLTASLISSSRTPAIEIADAFVKSNARKGRALALLGPTGIGKTFAAAAIVHAWPESSGAEQDPLFLEAGRFVSELLRWARETGQAHPLDTAVDVALLALDDLGIGYLKPGGYGEGALEELLHARHAALAPTIVTSNMTPAQLARRLSARLYDRLREWADVVELGGPSMRAMDL